MQAFSGCSEQGLLFVSVHGLLIAVASFVVKWGLWSTGSVVLVHKLSCSKARGIFSHQGLNPCPLHWQEESYALDHQGSPSLDFSVLTVNNRECPVLQNSRIFKLKEALKFISTFPKMFL